MSEKVVIWDFDGVIADTFHMCFDIIRLSNTDLTEEEYRQRFEGNINKIKKDKKEKQVVDFFSKYESQILNQKLVDGIKEPIRILGSTYPSAIVSSTINKPIEKFLEYHDIKQYFREILGNDISESKEEKLKMLFEKFHTSAQDCVFITDTLGDIEEAKKVNIESVAVTWGYHSRLTLEKGNPAIIVDNPSDIIQSVRDIFDENWEIAKRR